METFEMLREVYDESSMMKSNVYVSHQHFKELRKSIKNSECIGQPLILCNTENVPFVSESVKKNHCQTFSQIAEYANWYLLINAPAH